jgi:hypothetical protein
MSVNDLIFQLHTAPTNIEFEQTMQIISQFYDYTPTNFTNRVLVNEAGSNESSCNFFILHS